MKSINIPEDIKKKTLDELMIVKNWKQRKELLRTPSVIIAPAGMMLGGFSSFYKDGIIKKYKKNSLLRKPNIGMFKIINKRYYIKIKYI